MTATNVPNGKINEQTPTGGKETDDNESGDY